MLLSTSRARAVLVNARLFSTAAASASKPKLLLYRSESSDPFFNLAAEEWIFNTQDPQAHSLFWWRNGPSVIIGRFQNPWKECHVQMLVDNNVNLVRRKSGGGAVYQDLGNSIYTFVSPKKEFSIPRNNQIIVNALERFGIKAVPTGRNDIVVDGKKVSGAAFKHSLQHSLHHGTLLVNLDTTALPRYLNPNKAKLASKGVSSVEARVQNMIHLAPNMTHETLGDVLIQAFLKDYGAASTEIIPLNEKVLAGEKLFTSAFEELKDWNFRFGKTPEFTHNLETRFDWGIMDVFFNCKNGIITNATIYSDVLYPVLVETLQKQLTGVRYDVSSVKAALREAAGALKDTPCEKFVAEFEAWLVQKM